MHKELFSIGPFTANSYGLMIALGVIAAYIVVQYRGKRLKIDLQYIDSIALCILVGGIGGAKILYWLTQIQEIIKNPSILLDFTDGFVVYGGLIGGILATYLYCRKKRLPFMEYFDLIIPSVALAQGFGRIGCFLAGCCYGIQTSHFGVIFPAGSLAPSGVPLLPTQLLSSALNFLHFFILIFYSKKKKADGQVAALYLILYSAGRFVLEFFRGDLIRGTVGALTTSQFIAIFLFLFGCALFIIKNKRAE